MRARGRLSSFSVGVLGVLAACGTGHGVGAEPELTASVAAALTEVEYLGAELLPTSCDDKCDTDRGGAKIELIIIHDTQQEWDDAVNTLRFARRRDPAKPVVKL